MLHHGYQTFIGQQQPIYRGKSKIKFISFSNRCLCIYVLVFFLFIFFYSFILVELIRSRCSSIDWGCRKVNYSNSLVYSRLSICGHLAITDTTPLHKSQTPGETHKEITEITPVITDSRYYENLASSKLQTHMIWSDTMIKENKEPIFQLGANLRISCLQPDLFLVREATLETYPAISDPHLRTLNLPPLPPIPPRVSAITVVDGTTKSINQACFSQSLSKWRVNHSSRIQLQVYLRFFKKKLLQCSMVLNSFQYKERRQ